MVLWPIVHLPFINYDDPINITQNSHVRHGFTADSIRYAWTNLDAGYYIPLTWMSLMADAHGTGPLDAARFHRTNLFLHCATASILFLVLRIATRRTLLAALAALVFALHPQRIESVAWVTERKDVLAGFFGSLCIFGYVLYARKPSAAGLIATTAVFALSLLAKPMLLTLPIALILLDFWPLRRFEAAISDSSTSPLDRSPGRRLVNLLIEKLPFLFLSAAAGLAAYIGERNVGAVSASHGRADLLDAAANAAISYFRYIHDLFLPNRLCIFYPARHWPGWQAMLAAIALIAITLAAIAQRRARPWLLTGWLWYVILLLPTAGFMRIGAISMADRYTYFPTLGLWVALLWTLPARWTTGHDFENGRTPQPRFRLSVALLSAAALLIALSLQARMQLTFWRDSLTLFQHALAVAGDSNVVHDNIGQALADQHKLDPAAAEFLRALQISPHDGDAHYNLGVVRFEQGQVAQAEQEFRAAIAFARHPARATSTWAFCCSLAATQLGAVAEYRHACQLEPAVSVYRANLGAVLLQTGNLEEAIEQEQIAVRLDPHDFESRVNLGLALARSRLISEAIVQYRAALKLNPAAIPPRQMLAMLLAQDGQLEPALAELDEILRRDPASAPALRTRRQVLDALNQK